MYKIFDTLEQYNQYTDNGTNLTSGVTYYVKEDGSSHFQTNNIDGEMKKYDMMDNEDLINFIERNITSITIPSGVTSIGDYAFSYCTVLTSITIPNSVTSINKAAFWHCYGLTSITIPNSVTRIGENAFQNCTGLASITIPDSVTNINKAAFYGCSGLTSITFGSGVTNIGDSAFGNCTGLASITIPDSVTSIENNAFRSCENFTSITIQATNPPTLGTNVFLSTNNCPIYVPTESVDTYKAATNWSNYADRIQAIPTD